MLIAAAIPPILVPWAGAQALPTGYGLRLPESGFVVLPLEFSPSEFAYTKLEMSLLVVPTSEFNISRLLLVPFLLPEPG